jgi:hypothetical protein
VPSGDDSLERLRLAIDQLATFDVDGLLTEARAEARARVRATLVDLMEHSMLEQVELELSPPRQTQRTPSAAPPPPPPPPPEPEREIGSAWYVYGVVKSDAVTEAELPGVDATRPVELFAEGSIAAAVSEVDLEEFGEAPLRERLRDMAWVERVARGHETVLEQIRAQATVVPMRMCTVYRSESRVREMLRLQESALRRAIDHLDGKAEWGVKVFSDPSELTAVGLDAPDDQESVDEARGAAYMRRRQGERDRRERERQQLEESAEQIHERLSTLAGDGHMLPPQRPEVSGHAGDMVLNGVYLVSNDSQERFHAEVQALEDEFAPLGVKLVLTGPWPPYNFVPGTIGAGW